MQCIVCLVVLFAALAAGALLPERDLFHNEQFFGRASRVRRGANEDQLHSWLTADQKAVLRELEQDTKEFKDKVMEFYNKLSVEQREKLDEFYKKECSAWVKKVASAEEWSAFEKAQKSNPEEAEKKKDEYLSRLEDKDRKAVQNWRSECKDLEYKTRSRRHLDQDDSSEEVKIVSSSRRRRGLDKNFADFVSWMTEEQKKELESLKNAGSSMSELREKTIGFFNQLPEDKQKSLKEEYKAKCKAYFSSISSPDEVNEIKALHESGQNDKIKEKINVIIDRQTGNVKEVAKKMEGICADVFAEPKKKRRDVGEKIDKHLGWLTDEQKKQIREMHAAGKSREEIRNTLFEFLNKMDPESKKAAKEKTRQECYKWLEKAASKAEIEELHKLHETDHGACKTKVREYIARLDAADKAEVEKNLPFCEKVWYGDHDNHAHHGHKHAHRYRRHLHAIEKYIDWLTPEQSKTLRGLELQGEDFDKILEKVREYYNAHSNEKKEELKAKFKDQCAAWVKDVATNEEKEKLKNFYDTGDTTGIKELLTELENRLSEEVKHTVEHVRDVCMTVWNIKESRSKREHSHNLEDAFKQYLSWLTDLQKQKIRELDTEGGDKLVYKQVIEYFHAADGEVKIKAAEQLKGACKHFSADLFGEDKVAELKKMKESGASFADMDKKVTELIEAMAEGEKKEQAKGLQIGCSTVFKFQNSRKRRDHHHHKLYDAFTKYLTWLSDDQKTELKEMETAGKKNEIYKKVLEFFDAAEGATKAKAAEELKGACKHYGTDIFGAEKIEQIKALKESGASENDIEKKVNELIDELPEGEKREKANRLRDECSKIYKYKPSRLRRHEHTFEEANATWLAWTTDTQRKELKELYDAGKKDDVYKKVLKYFDEAIGETKVKAAEQLKSACKHFGTDLFGTEKMAQLTALKESGTPVEEIHKKIESFAEGLDSDEKKEKAAKLVIGCKKIYEFKSSRKRRDLHDHKIEDALKNWLAWTTDEQKAELKALDAEGKKDEIVKKIDSYFEASTGETKSRAAEGLKAACKHYANDLFGEDKTAEIKKLREGGASTDDIQKKLQTFAESLDSEEKKDKAAKLIMGCKKYFDYKPSRMRREHHEHNIEDGFKTYLTWTTEEQKEELRTLWKDGKKDDAYKKIDSYFDALSGETKKKAAEELKAACRHYATDLFGAEKTAELKTLRESGASTDEIVKKLEKFAEGLDSEEKKDKAAKLIVGCKKYFEFKPSRMRREHHEHNVDESLKTYLSWATAEQKEEIKSLWNAGKKDEMYKKIYSFFDALSGETKNKAAEGLKAACKHYATDIFGAEKTAEIKQMKDSGASNDEIQKKLETFAEALDSAEKKEKAAKMIMGCKKYYDYKPTRMRRDKHEHKIEDSLKTYLSWTTAEQQEEFKSLFNAGKKDEAYKKVDTYFDALSGENKNKAAEGLKAACKHYAVDIFGEEKTAELKKLKDEGASNDEIQKKLEAFAETLGSEEKKDKAAKLIVGCKKYYDYKPTRLRRDHANQDNTFTKYLTWLTPSQRAQIEDMRDNGSTDDIVPAVMNFYNDADESTQNVASERLQAACKHYGADLFGKEKISHLMAMKEAGKSHEEVRKQIEKWAEEIVDEDVKENVGQVIMACKEVYESAKLRRVRRHEHNLGEAFEKWLTWTTEEQKDELRALYKSDKKKDIFQTILKYFDAATGETKTKAAEELKAGCKHYGTDLFGAEKMDELKQLKESGTSTDEIQKKIESYAEALDTDEKKDKAAQLIIGCKKIYDFKPKRALHRHYRHRDNDFVYYV